MNESRNFRRPVMLPNIEGETTELDPAARAELSHTTASLLISRGRSEADEDAVRRFVTLADEVGFETIARMWADAPPISLPGALWRLFVIREWIQRAPSQAAREFDAGLGTDQVSEVVAGVESPPGPDAVRTMADRILAGLFTGDFAVSIERAAAFVSVVRLGRASLAAEPVSNRDAEDPARPRGDLAALAATLMACADAWRQGTLD